MASAPNLVSKQMSSDVVPDDLAHRFCGGNPRVHRALLHRLQDAALQRKVGQPHVLFPTQPTPAQWVRFGGIHGEHLAHGFVSRDLHARGAPASAQITGVAPGGRKGGQVWGTDGFKHFSFLGRRSQTHALTGRFQGRRRSWRLALGLLARVPHFPTDDHARATCSRKDLRKPGLLRCGVERTRGVLLHAFGFVDHRPLQAALRFVHKGGKGSTEL